MLSSRSNVEHSSKDRQSSQDKQSSQDNYHPRPYPRQPSYENYQPKPYARPPRHDQNIQRILKKDNIVIESNNKNNTQ